MLAKIIDGKKCADEMIADLKTQVINLSKISIFPKLTIILIGDNTASRIYVNNKLQKAHYLGIKAELIQLDINITENKLIDIIKTLNEDKETHGIIVQMPIPEHINKFNIISAIDPRKDVDGFHPINVGLNNLGAKYGFIPCTALGVLHLIKSVCPDVSGKHVVILGRSTIVGKPLASLLSNNDATVTLCHSKTKNLEAITVKADIIVTAIGVAEKFGLKYFSQGQIVIDVGINQSNF